jgi:AcrR family transcriptional regulator
MRGRGITPDAVVDTAVRLLDEERREPTLAEVARRLGVRPPSLYEHVRNREVLLDAVAARAADRLADLLTDAVAGRARAAALNAYGAALRSFVSAHPGQYAATLRPPPRSEPIPRGYARIAQSCAALLRGYDLPEDAGVDAVRFVRSTLHGFTRLEADGGFRDPADRTRSWEACLAAIDRALTSWPPPTSSTQGEPS